MRISGDFRDSVHLWTSVYFSLPVAIVTAALLWGPLARENALPAWFYGLSWVFLAIVPLLEFFACAWTMKGEGWLAFFGRFVALALARQAVVLALALTVHRDFFTAVFQELMILPILFLVRVWTARETMLERATLGALERIAIILAAFYAQWIFMMGYAIATRSEPRPIESVAYNAYNLGLVLILLFSSARLNLMGFRRVFMNASSVRIDERDLTALAGERKVALLNRFAASPNLRLTCAQINAGEAECPAPADGMCSPESTKAACCPRYRSTYNRVLELKKFLEAMEVGSITSGTNRRNVLEDGWRLVPFDGVKFTRDR